MRSYDDFMSWVLPDVPGCAEVAAVVAVRDAAIQLCEESLIHQVDHDPINVTQGVVDYDLESPVPQTRVVRIMQAWYQGEQLSPVAPDHVVIPSVYNQSIGGYSAPQGTPRRFLQKDDATLSLIPVPDATLASAVTLRVAVIPTRSSSVCADFLLERWVETITAGALARLQSKIGRTFFNPAAAKYHLTQFQVGINKARLLANNGQTRAGLQMQLRPV